MSTSGDIVELKRTCRWLEVNIREMKAAKVIQDNRIRELEAVVETQRKQLRKFRDEIQEEDQSICHDGVVRQGAVAIAAENARLGS